MVDSEKEDSKLRGFDRLVWSSELLAFAAGWWAAVTVLTAGTAHWLEAGGALVLVILYGLGSRARAKNRGL